MKYKKILTIILKEFIYIHYYNLIIIQFKNKTGAINITNYNIILKNKEK